MIILEPIVVLNTYEPQKAIKKVLHYKFGQFLCQNKFNDDKLYFIQCIWAVHTTYPSSTGKVECDLLLSGNRTQNSVG